LLSVPVLTNPGRTGRLRTLIVACCVDNDGDNYKGNDDKCSDNKCDDIDDDDVCKNGKGDKKGDDDEGNERLGLDIGIFV